jgi:hypothetical protein
MGKGERSLVIFSKLQAPQLLNMGKGERSLVIFSKLQAPQIRTKILRRSRLVKLLSENLEKKLIFICAGGRLWQDYAPFAVHS